MNFRREMRSTEENRRLTIRIVFQGKHAASCMACSSPQCIVSLLTRDCEGGDSTHQSRRRFGGSDLTLEGRVVLELHVRYHEIVDT